MNLSQEHIDFENHIQRIVGMTLLRVDYLEINYEPEHPKPFYKSHFNEIDSIDFSIIFQTNIDKIEFYWDGHFYRYGIGIRFNEFNETATGQKWEVSNDKLWGKFIGQKIVNVKLSWQEVKTFEENTGKSDKFIYPQDLRIDFSNAKSIFISAAGFLNKDDEEVMGLMDNLTVTDNEFLARQVKMIK